MKCCGSVRVRLTAAVAAAAARAAGDCPLRRLGSCLQASLLVTVAMPECSQACASAMACSCISCLLAEVAARRITPASTAWSQAALATAVGG